MKKRLAKITRVVGITLIFIGTILFTANTRALGKTDLEIEKAMLNGLYDCYTAGAMTGSISISKQVSGATVYKNERSVFDQKTSREKMVYLPTYFSGVDNTGQFSCEDLFLGGASGFSGIFALNGIPTPNSSDNESVDTYLTNLGYTKTAVATGSGGYCVSINFSDSRIETGNNIVHSMPVCFSGLVNEKFSSGSTTIEILDNNLGQYQPIKISKALRGGLVVGNAVFQNVEINDGDTVDAIANKILERTVEVYKDSGGCKTAGPGMGEQWTYCIAEEANGSRIHKEPYTDKDSTVYTMKSPQEAFFIAREKLKLPQDTAYTDEEKFVLYQSYLAQYYGLSVICGKSSDEENAVYKGSGYTSTVYAWHDGSLQDCLINVGNLDGNKKVVGFNGNKLGSVLSAQEIVTQINGLKGGLGGNLTSSAAARIGKYKNGKKEDGSIIVEPAKPGDTPIDNPSDGSTAEEDKCYGKAGTLGMGWIVCPILSGLSNSLNWFYSNIAKDYLQVDPQLIGNGDSENITYENWGIFQNAANVLMAIFLLVVIFSQLTGIGIDNYGIKKILPRLIICAVLINLSYFIVQFFVDISNIIGNSIGNIFNISGIVASVESGEGVDLPNTVLGFTVWGGAAVGAASILMNPAGVLGILLALLAGIFSVLMMWVILVVRQALVVIAVIIAPIAIALYMLPNTSRYTKSWINFLKSLLILYPEAAFIIGASYAASDIVLNINADMTIPALLLRVMPFIALPELFRRSVNVLDNLGSRITNFGQGISRSATGAVRNSDWYKNAQERGLERRTRLRAGLDENGNEARGWRRAFSIGSDRNRARYRAQYLKDRSKQDEAEMLNDAEYMSGTLEKQELMRKNESANAKLYNTPGFRESKESQYNEARQGELRKMFTEQNLSQGTTAEKRRDRLSELLKNGLRGENDAAEAEALIDLLNDKGDIRQLIDGLNGASSAEFATMNADLRSRIAGRAQATGNPLLKGWAKSVNKGNVINIDDYIARSGDGGLNNYITTDAGTNLFDNSDKDTLEFLSAHGGARAFVGNGAEAALANMATTVANSSPRASTAVNNMIKTSGRTKEVSSHITASNLSKMARSEIARTLMSDASKEFKDAIATIKAPGNEQLLSGMNNDVRKELGLS